MDNFRRKLFFSQDSSAGEYVDLGLPSGIKWARGNICKDSEGNYYIGEPTEYGCYFSWGNVKGHNEGEGYLFNSTTYNGTPGSKLTADISPTSGYDAARTTLGGNWRMPTKDEFKELYDNTDIEYSYPGLKFMKKSDHSVYIYFPSSGYYWTRSSYPFSTLEGKYYNGLYWASTYISSKNAQYMSFNKSSVMPQSSCYREYGLTVRAVQ